MKKDANDWIAWGTKLLTPLDPDGRFFSGFGLDASDLSGSLLFGTDSEAFVPDSFSFFHNS